MRKNILPLIMLSLGALPLYAPAQDTSALWGKKYVEVKSSLLAAGWVLAPVAEDETPMTEDYPEITCGNGAMAICSVGFKREKTTLALVVESIEQVLVVTGEY
ncbi:hypothetical protein CKQ84_23605 [Shewanella sp. WE21]|uniref:hypothetical protein n=1 Tax=unclassified Shewanella TaxID=196818 RepID=UPI000CF64286|nr:MULTISPECIES: hypothetical protein [unclassified Shewanella]AVI68572.1 hypothetical protein CKQ84_23605 [Shewanella sp. WE21]NRD32532.1 hypothetical protein [Shewanella sp. DC2-4]